MFKKVVDLFKLLEEKGISIANFSKQSGVNPERMHSWKAGRGNPKAEDSELIQKWLDTYIYNNSKEISSENKAIVNESITTTAKDSEVLRLLTLTEKITDSHLGLVRSHENLTIDHHKIINQNEYLTKVLEKDIGQKINLNSIPNSQQATETFVRLLSESLASKYSLNQSDLRRDIGNTLFALKGSKLSSDIQKNENNEDN